jgi:hypothetical protein
MLWRSPSNEKGETVLEIEELDAGMRCGWRDEVTWMIWM